MKIGLIGINKYAKFLNFACDLHVYAFQEYLAQNGHDVTILDYKPAYFNNFNMRHPAGYAEQKYRDTIVRKATTSKQLAAREKDLEKWAELAIGYRSVAPERERRYDKFEAFVGKHLKFTAEVYDSDLLEVEDPGFDCYICVTDVIWQSIPQHTFDRGFLLGSKAFEGKQKIAYAASRGASPDFTEAEAELFFGYLSDIDDISVREADFGTYIEENSKYSAPTVVDPVMLHDKKFWQKVSEKPQLERFVVLYYVMEQATDTIAKAVEYAKANDLTLVELSDRPLKHGRVTDPDVKHIARYDVGMEEWLGYIEHADAVFTNSFHGCCFSVLFEKTFFVGKRNGQKVPNFLASFGLTSRQFTRETKLSQLPGPIDYEPVEKKLESIQSESAAFILGALDRAQSRIASGEHKDLAAYEQKRRSITYPVNFHSGSVNKADAQRVALATGAISSKKTKSGATEYTTPGQLYTNDGRTILAANRFVLPGHELAGWNLRFRVDNRWFWYLDDGTVVPGAVTGEGLKTKAVIADGAEVPYLPVNRVSVAVFVAQWRPATKK